MVYLGYIKGKDSDSKMNQTQFNNKTYTMKTGANGIITLIPVPTESPEDLLRKKRHWAGCVLRDYASEFNFLRDGSCIYALSKDSFSRSAGESWGKSWGKSICSASDEFDYAIGQAVAICKATGNPIPDYVM